jgi:hypothetical protein
MGITERWRYSEPYVRDVSGAKDREYLVTVGLPAMSAVFVAGEETKESPIIAIDGRVMLKLGKRNGVLPDSYYVACDTGDILSVDPVACLHVNASPRLFSDCLEIFDDAIKGKDLREAEGISRSLTARITERDPTAFSEEDGFWASLMWDVAIGDFTPDMHPDEDW